MGGIRENNKIIRPTHLIVWFLSPVFPAGLFLFQYIARKTGRKESKMSKTQIYLPPEVAMYMTECEAEPGSREWFAAAFLAVASCAIDNCEYLTEEFSDLFCDDYEDGIEIYEAVEKLKEEVGLAAL